MNTVLQLKNGQYKDFTSLQVAYEMRYGKDDNSARIFDASLIAAMWNHSPKEQRAMIYRQGSLWMKLIKDARL